MEDTMGSATCSGTSPGTAAVPSSLTADDTPTLVMYRGPTVRWPGASSTRNISVCPSDAKGSSLLHMLDLDLTEETLARYSLTRQAKDGVLDRRSDHAKPPSPFLKKALLSSVDLKGR